VSVAPTGIGFGGFNVPLSSCSVRNSGFGFSSIPTVRSPREFQAAALARFSQNSKELVCFGSGQAQPGQSNPSGWFIDKSDLPPLRSALGSRNAFATSWTEPQPPAMASLGSNFGACDICGLLHLAG